MGTTTWVIGSHPAIGACTITIDEEATGTPDTMDILTAESPLYLYNGGSGSYDALFKLQTAIRAYNGGGVDVSTTAVYLNRDRKVQIDFIDAGAGPVTAQITDVSGAGATDFLALIGFDGTELDTPAETITASLVSPYLWSANASETSLEARTGELGAPYFDTAVGQSGTRVVVATQNNSGYTNTFNWPNVVNDRYWSSTQENGEYYVWWEYVQRRFRRFKLWRGVNELDGSTTAATIPAGALGPYMYRWDGNAPLSFPFTRDIDFYEFLHTVTLPVVVVDEYS